PPSSAARRRALERRAQVDRASDEALAVDRRGPAAFPREPRSVAELVEASERWAALVASKYASTPARAKELEAAEAARTAAHRLAPAVATGFDSLSDARVDEDVTALRFAGLIAAVKAARTTAAEVAKEQAPALASPERGSVSPRALLLLADTPFADR